jgi:hypothetical protein
MTSTFTHIAVGLATLALFVAGGFVISPRMGLLKNLAIAVAAGVAAAVLITAIRRLG